MTLLGVFLMALTGASLGAYSVHGRKFKSSFTYTYNGFLLFGGGPLAVTPFAYSMLGKNLWENISLTSLALTLFLGMISTALSYVLWHMIMKKIHAFQGGVFQLIVPVLTAFMGVLFLREEINTSLVVGGILVLMGIGLNIF
ncbi:MAG: DMT family transporter [Candidatus Methanomethylicia archaeon]